MPSFMQQKVSDLLQQCTFKQLKQIHAFIITTALQRSIQIASSFLRRSTEFGEMEYAELVFSQMADIFRVETFLWNAIIRGYAFNGPHEKCISVFDEMIQRGLQPNNYTYPHVLSSCAEMGCHKQGKKVHGRIVKEGFEQNFSVSNSLLNLYVKNCSSSELGIMKTRKLSDARLVFDGMMIKPIELWNRMISENVNVGDFEVAEQLFQEMPERDVISWNCMISGYARAGDLTNARILFDQMPEKNVVSWTSMMGAYASSGDLKTARTLFEKMPKRNVISWNSMISNYTLNGKFKEALDLFIRMHSTGETMDGFTFVSALSACSQEGALEFGKWIHCLIKDWSQIGVVAGTALIEMYAKCGDIDRAFNVFMKIGKKDVFCWNVMIKSLAIHGRIDDSIKIFYMMQNEGLKPNEFTFTGALFACNHGGLVKEGREIFCSMAREFGYSPKLEHFGCLIDLLCRNGQLEEARSLMREMPFEPDIAIWGALLGGCRVRGDVRLAETVMEKVDELKTKESGVYVLLSNIYASADQWSKAVNMRDQMVEKRMCKKTGCSSVV